MELTEGVRSALRTWYNDARAMLISEDPVPRAVDLGMPWRIETRDDVVLLRAEDQIDFVWPPEVMERLRQLPSWQVVIDASQSLVPSLSLISPTAPLDALSRICPSPDQVDSGQDSFDEDVETFADILAGGPTNELVWIIPRLQMSEEVALSDRVTLGPMRLIDSVHALNFGILQPSGTRVVRADEITTTCSSLRQEVYNTEDMEYPGVNARLLPEMLALARLRNVRVAGYYEVTVNPRFLGYGRMSAQMRPWGSWAFPVRFPREFAADLVSLWNALAIVDNAGTKGLSLAIERLAYHSERERAIDEVLDLLIAAEALFLSDHPGSEKYRGELRYRLGVNAAIYSTAATLRFGRRKTMKLMQKAYDLRSTVAHGGSLPTRAHTVDGATYTNEQLLESTREIVAEGCVRAVKELAAGVPWPPDWSELLFPLNPSGEMAD